MKRISATFLFVTGYWLMACLDASVAFVPSVASFLAASALLVGPVFAESYSD